MARSQISGPHTAISSLLAVTTDLPFAIAPRIISAATVVPPTSSATMSTPGWETTSRQSVVFNSGSKASRNFLGRYRWAAHRGDLQRKAQLERDLIGVLRQNSESS